MRTWDVMLSRLSHYEINFTTQEREFEDLGSVNALEMERVISMGQSSIYIF